MGVPRDRSRDEFAPVGAFVNSLPTLKQSGCALLVVGDVPTDVHAYASRQMLGQTSDEVRNRLIVLTNGDYRGASHRLPLDQSTTGGTSSIILHDPRARSAAAKQLSVSDDVSVRQLVDANISDLAVAIHNEIDRLEPGTVALEPASLRVCISSISQLLATDDMQTVFRFLHLISGRVKHSKGIIHVHFPIQRDSRDVTLVEPLFDAIIELRIQGSEIQQRWRMTDQEGMSRWMVM